MLRQRILVVDDEQTVLDMLCSALGERYEVDAVLTGEEAIEKLGGSKPYAVVVADMIMPGVNGIQVLTRAEQRHPLTVRIMLSGDPKRQTALDAVNCGHVFRFLPKPVSAQEWCDTIDLAAKRYEVAVAEQKLLDTTLRSSINILLEVVSTTDPQSFELSQRLRRTVRYFAAKMHIPNAWELEMAASLARIGVATLPASLLRNMAMSETLSFEERKLLKNVPDIGWQLLKTVPRLERVAEAVKYQCKNYDGSGVPADACARENIPLAARILKIFTDRALLEMEGIAKSNAHRAMIARAGEYDPELLRASFECFPEYILYGASSTAEVLMLKVEDLVPDQTVVVDIKTKDDLVIVAAGSRLTTMMIQRIGNHLELGTVSEPFCVQDLPPEPGVDAVAPPSLSAPALASV